MISLPLLSQLPSSLLSAPSAKGHDASAETSSIQLRRFAGPRAFVGALSHVRVAHLTDMHFGRVTPMEVQRAAVALTNACEPDLVAITGDFVCHGQRYLDAVTDVLGRLAAPAIAVLGNHDHWSGADEVRRALRRAGALVLDNAHTTVTLRRERIQVVGLDDAYTGHADRDAAVRGLRSDLPTLALSHIAEEADGLWQHGIPLVLSGHTHAGQITVARLHELAVSKLAGHRYVHGLYGTRERDKAPHGAVYVGAGIGAAVVPLRLGERGQREVAMFELGVAPGTLVEHHAEQAPFRGHASPPGLLSRHIFRSTSVRPPRRHESRNDGEIRCPPPAALRASAPPKSGAPRPQGGERSGMADSPLAQVVSAGGAQ